MLKVLIIPLSGDFDLIQELNLFFNQNNQLIYNKIARFYSLYNQTYLPSIMFWIELNYIDATELKNG